MTDAIAMLSIHRCTCAEHECWENGAGAYPSFLEAKAGMFIRCTDCALLRAHLCSAPVTLGLVDLDCDRHKDKVFFPFWVLVWTIELRTELLMDTISKHCNLG